MTPITELIGNQMTRMTTIPSGALLSNTPILWETVTIAGVREAILNHRVTSLIESTGNRDREFESFASVHDALLEATTAGRVFDLGYLPNKVLISEAKRAGVLYGAGHIGHPFRQTYLLFHKWELGGALYMVKRNEKVATNFTALEFQCITLPLGNFLIQGDGVDVRCGINQKGDYHAELHPSAALSHAIASGYPETPAAAIGSLIDPIVACMLLLATDGVRVQRVDASEKLNKARVKNRKPIIPPYWQVETKPYITALLTKPSRKDTDHEHGHHRSPIPHLRRGHVRNLSARHGGGITWIRDALVNLKDPDEGLSRSFYQMQQDREK